MKEFVMIIIYQLAGVALGSLAGYFLADGIATLLY